MPEIDWKDLAAAQTTGGQCLDGSRAALRDCAEQKAADAARAFCTSKGGPVVGEACAQGAKWLAGKAFDLIADAWEGITGAREEALHAEQAAEWDAFGAAMDQVSLINQALRAALDLVVEQAGPRTIREPSGWTDASGQPVENVFASYAWIWTALRAGGVPLEATPRRTDLDPDAYRPPMMTFYGSGVSADFVVSDDWRPLYEAELAESAAWLDRFQLVSAPLVAIGIAARAAEEATTGGPVAEPGKPSETQQDGSGAGVVVLGAGAVLALALMARRAA